jgi:Ca2+/Na+ antiporter
VSTTQASARHAVGVVIPPLLGAAFFNIIIGVFGLSAAIVGLLLFISLAIVIFRRPQKESAPQ